MRIGPTEIIIILGILIVLGSPFIILHFLRKSDKKANRRD